MRSKVGLMWENVAKLGEDTKTTHSHKLLWFFQCFTSVVISKCLETLESSWWTSPAWSYGRAMTWTTCQTAKTRWRACRSRNIPRVWWRIPLPLQSLDMFLASHREIVWESRFSRLQKDSLFDTEICWSWGWNLNWPAAGGGVKLTWTEPIPKLKWAKMSNSSTQSPQDGLWLTDIPIIHHSAQDDSVATLQQARF